MYVGLFTSVIRATRFPSCSLPAETTFIGAFSFHCHFGKIGVKAGTDLFEPHLIRFDPQL